MSTSLRAIILAALPVAGLTTAGAATLEPPCEQQVGGPVLTLQAAADRLRSCNPDVLQARAAAAAAQADLLTADHWQNPALGLGVSNINPKAGTGGGALADRTVDSSIRIDQLFERGGKRAARRDAAQATGAATRESLRDTELRSEQDLLEAYLDVTSAAEAYELLTQAAASYRQSTDAMERRFAAGDAARLEVMRSVLDSGRAEADASAAASALGAARSDLAGALGARGLAPGLRLLSLDQLTARRTPFAPQELDADAVAQDRADVKAASARLDAARAALRGARAARATDVDVSVGFDHWPVSATNTQGTGNSFSIGVSIPLRIFDSGQGPVGHAVADVDAAQAELRRVTAAAETQIHTAEDELARASTLAERYRNTLLPGSTAVLEAEESAFRRGGV